MCLDPAIQLTTLPHLLIQMSTTVQKPPHPLHAPEPLTPLPPLIAPPLPRAPRDPATSLRCLKASRSFAEQPHWTLWKPETHRSTISLSSLLYAAPALPAAPWRPPRRAATCCWSSDSPVQESIRSTYSGRWKKVRCVLYFLVTLKKYLGHDNLV